MRTAMPSPVARPESAILCPPPTDPTGFIYPSYRAAQTETLTDKPSLNSSHQGVAYVSSSVGGSLSQIFLRGDQDQVTASVLVSIVVEAPEIG